MKDAPAGRLGHSRTQTNLKKDSTKMTDAENQVNQDIVAEYAQRIEVQMKALSEAGNEIGKEVLLLRESHGDTYLAEVLKTLGLPEESYEGFLRYQALYEASLDDDG